MPKPPMIAWQEAGEPGWPFHKPYFKKGKKMARITQSEREGVAPPLKKEKKAAPLAKQPKTGGQVKTLFPNHSLDGLTIEQITAIVALGRGSSYTDEKARVPPGTLKSLVKLGYAVYISPQVGYGSTPAAREKAKEWLLKGLAEKAPKQPVEKKAGGRGRVAGPPKLPLDATIKALKDVNPSRVGTKAYSYYELILRGGTVQAYMEAGGAINYLTWYVDRGLAEVSNG